MCEFLDGRNQGCRETVNGSEKVEHLSPGLCVPGCRGFHFLTNQGTQSLGGGVFLFLFLSFVFFFFLKCIFTYTVQVKTVKTIENVL